MRNRLGIWGLWSRRLTISRILQNILAVLLEYSELRSIANEAFFAVRERSWKTPKYICSYPTKAKHRVTKATWFGFCSLRDAHFYTSWASREDDVDCIYYPSRVSGKRKLFSVVDLSTLGYIIEERQSKTISWILNFCPILHVFWS
jgi:hypothetical protein